VPWFSFARLLVISCFAMTGLITFFVPREQLISGVLVIWAAATLPQTIVAVCFGVVMNAVAGPKHRYELMSRRWSILGVTTAITVAIVGQVLDRVAYPTNYQLAFLGLSLGGLVSYYFSSHIKLPDSVVPDVQPGLSPWRRLKNYFRLIMSEKAFIRFSMKRFVFGFATTLSVPLFPLYYVREVEASDAWIGIINTAQSAILLVGYFFWTRQSRSRGSRFVLLWTTFGMTLYPALVAITHRVELIALYAGISGIFQAGMDLVFFDEMMKTVPAEYSATFVSFWQSLFYLASILAPFAGTFLAETYGLAAGLLASALLRLVGFLFFLK
jgi:hypothetical protein